jgi:hypothetical protein
MDSFKRRQSAASAEKREHGDVENGARRISAADAAAYQHREDDDRADEAKGRNADQMDRKYWLSGQEINPL